MHLAGSANPSPPQSGSSRCDSSSDWSQLQAKRRIVVPGRLTMQRMQWINRPSLFSLSDKRLAPPQALRSTCQPPHHFHTLRSRSPRPTSLPAALPHEAALHLDGPRPRQAGPRKGAPDVKQKGRITLLPHVAHVQPTTLAPVAPALLQIALELIQLCLSEAGVVVLATSSTQS